MPLEMYARSGAIPSQHALVVELYNELLLWLWQWRVLICPVSLKQRQRGYLATSNRTNFGKREFIKGGCYAVWRLDEMCAKDREHLVEGLFVSKWHPAFINMLSARIGAFKLPMLRNELPFVNCLLDKPSQI